MDYFIAIVEEKNLTKAAQRLYISQPSLTRYVNRLEEEYGVKLLDRGQAPVELAAAGSLFLEEKLRIENTKLNLRKKLKQLSNPQAKITICIGYNRGTRWVPLS